MREGMDRRLAAERLQSATRKRIIEKVVHHTATQAMPLHDWTRVPPGIFHDFHQTWAIAIRNALNSGGLPEGYFALVEQVTGGRIPDVLTLHERATGQRNGGVAMAESPPQTRIQSSAETDIYVAKANRIAIHHPLGDVIAVIEIVSPGNKSNRHALRSFVDKALDVLDQGIHLLVIDFFPPGAFDPQGIHGAIWSEIKDESFELPPDKPLTLASYLSGPVKRAFVEPIAVGDALPNMPIFLSTETYVPAPLESTYQAAWSVTPPAVEALLG
jgi:hypothetical protein